MSCIQYHPVVMELAPLFWRIWGFMIFWCAPGWVEQFQRGDSWHLTEWPCCPQNHRFRMNSKGEIEGFEGPNFEVKLKTNLSIRRIGSVRFWHWRLRSVTFKSRLGGGYLDRQFRWSSMIFLSFYSWLRFWRGHVFLGLWVAFFLDATWSSLLHPPGDPSGRERFGRALCKPESGRLARGALRCLTASNDGWLSVMRCYDQWEKHRIRAKHNFCEAKHVAVTFSFRSEVNSLVFNTQEHPPWCLQRILKLPHR